MRNSIRARLILVFIILAIGPLLVVGGILAWQSYALLEQQALTLQQEAAKRVTSQVAAFFRELEDELRFTIQTQRLGDQEQDRQRSILSNLLAYQSAFDELHLLNSQGQEQVGVYRVGLASTAPVDRSHADEFVIPKTSGQAYYGPVHYDPVTNEPFMTIAIPVVNLRTGVVDGVLVSVARIKTIWDLIAGIQLSPGQSVYIVAAGGNVMAHRNPSIVLRGTTFTVPKQMGVQPGLSGARVVLAYDTMNLGQQQLSLVAEQPVTEALAPTFNTALVTLALVVVVVAIASAFGVLSVRQIVRPIQALAKTAEAISSGDLTAQAQVASNDEIGTLAANFNGMTAKLRQTLEGLEQRVAERTAELAQRSNELEKLNQTLQAANQSAERRAVRLAARGQVTRAASQIRDLDQLLPQVTHLISEAFGYYHVGIFIVDETGRYAMLRAADGEGGQRMLARNHKLAVGTEGIVGNVVSTGQPRVALDVGADAVHFDNPDLPETRSEIALPLQASGQTFGALDVQSTQAAAFADEDVAILSMLADQVAIAIDNARLFARTQSALQEAEETQKRYLRQEWERLLPTLPSTGHEYHASDVPPVGNAPLPEVEQAIQKGDVVAITSQAAARSALAVPIKLRDQLIGVIDLHEADAERVWTADDVALVTAVADQAALALENARLLEQTEQRARREQLVTQIATRVRAAADVEGILRTGVQEIRRVLGASHGVVRLRTESLVSKTGEARAASAESQEGNSEVVTQ
jgi:GAF domain-containing protein/HAMP domain-containing protein